MASVRVLVVKFKSSDLPRYSLTSRAISAAQLLRFLFAQYWDILGKIVPCILITHFCFDKNTWVNQLYEGKFYFGLSSQDSVYGWLAWLWWLEFLRINCVEACRVGSVVKCTWLLFQSTWFNSLYPHDSSQISQVQFQEIRYPHIEIHSRKTPIHL